MGLGHSKEAIDQLQQSQLTLPLKPKSKLTLARDYLHFAVWDEPAIKKDKYSEPMGVAESLGGPGPDYFQSQKERDLGRNKRRKERDIQRQKNREEGACPRVGFPFKDETDRLSSKVKENLPLAIEKLYVLEKEDKKSRR